MESNRILLVDDEPDIVRVLSISLKSDGYDVMTALSGEQALAIFQEQGQDIVITDIRMPGLNGIDVLKAVKEISDETEVIIITGHGDIDAAIEALKNGASDFINKPVRDQALSIALRRAQEKLDIKRRLKEYTVDLEQKVEIATRELRRQSNFQARLIRSSNDGVVATDRSLKIVIYNPAAERIFGFPATDVINLKYASDLFPVEIADRLGAAMSETNNIKDLAWQETSIVCKDGQDIPVRFSGAVLREKGVKMGTVVFFQDLREIKRLEQELLRSERLAAVGQTVAGLAHGLKNILHGLKGGSYLVDLGLKKDDTEKLRNGWDMIKRNINRTSRMVLDLLSYSKERQPEYEVCAPNEIAEDVCELMRDSALQNDIEIIKDFDPTIGRVVMDPQTLHETLLNLMTNAVDACLFDEDISKKWHILMKTALADEGVIAFEVSDNGAGMSPDVKEKLFTSFFSTKGHRGTGLGLMVTRKLVEEHGGEIQVTSRLGEGTTFTVLLPYQSLSE
jgi:PAS domain S-box-containing protein